MRRILSNLSYSFAANLLAMLVSVLSVLLVPRFWGETAYGYYQLYLFYISYVGFFHFGWVDGIYLRIGGEKYASLDKPLLAGQFYLLTVLAALGAIAIAVMASLVVQDANQLFVIFMFCGCILIYLPVTYINYILQATNCIKSYSRILFTEKTVFIIGLIFLFAVKDKEFKSLVCIDMAGKVAALLLAVFYAREFLFAGVCSLRRTFGEMIRNISVGCKLMIANVASMLIIGIVRFAIQSCWGVEVFGKISLSLSVSNLFITFVTAVSVVLFPILKQMDQRHQVEIYDFLRHSMIPILFLMLLFYSPMQFVLGFYLPAYKESLRYLAIMLPVCVFECKMSLLVNTYMKVLRKEKQLLRVNVTCVLLSLLVTLVTVYGLQSLHAAVVGIVVLVAMRVYLAEGYLARELRFSMKKEAFLEILLIVVFVLSGWFAGGWKAMIIYAASYSIYVLLIKEEIQKSLKYIKNGIFKKKI